MSKICIIRFAAYSKAVDEKGVHTFHFHTSNHEKYSVWAHMPDDASEAGSTMAFHWFRLPDAMEKLDAVRYLIKLPVVAAQPDIVAMLTDILNRKTTKKEKVTVIVKDPVNKPSKVGIDKMKEAAKDLASKRASKKSAA